MELKNIMKIGTGVITIVTALALSTTVMAAAKKVAEPASVVSGVISSIDATNYKLTITAFATSINVTASAKTPVTLAYGGNSKFKAFTLGDRITVFGRESATDGSIVATKITDYNAQKKNGTIVGTVTATDPAIGVSVLAKGVTYVINAQGDAKVTSGAVKKIGAEGQAIILVGDNITAVGIINPQAKTLLASKITVAVRKIPLSGKVGDVSTSSFTMTGNDGINYTVAVGAKATLTNSGGGKIVLSQIETGDTVNLTGTFSAGSAKNIEAKTVKDKTLGPVKSYAGTIIGDGIKVEEKSFSLASGKGTYKVMVMADAKITGKVTDFMALAVGNKVTVKGVMRSVNGLTVIKASAVTVTKVK